MSEKGQDKDFELEIFALLNFSKLNEMFSEVRLGNFTRLRQWHSIVQFTSGLAG